MNMTEINNEVVKNIREIGRYMTDQAQTSYELERVQNCVELLDEACKLVEEYSRVLDEQNRKLDMILEKLEDKV